MSQILPIFCCLTPIIYNLRCIDLVLSAISLDIGNIKYVACKIEYIVFYFASNILDFDQKPEFCNIFNENIVKINNLYPNKKNKKTLPFHI